MRKIFFSIFLFIFISYDCANLELGNKTALVVIDVQKGLFPIYDEDSVINNIKLLIQKAENRNIPIIYVQNNNNFDMKIGSTNWEIHDEIDPANKNNKIMVDKNTMSVFLSESFKETLQDLSVGRLVICGVNTDFCINAAVNDAKYYGYEIVIPEDAHSTNSYFGDCIINNYNNYWSKFADVIAARNINF